MAYGRLLVKLGRLLVAFLGKSWSSFGSLFKNIKSGKELLSLTVAPLSDIVEVWFGHLKRLTSKGNDDSTESGNKTQY